MNKLLASSVFSYRKQSGRGFFEYVTPTIKNVWKNAINKHIGSGVFEDASVSNIKLDKMKEQIDHAQTAKRTSIRDMIMNKTRENIKNATLNAIEKSIDPSIPLINTKPVQYNIRSIIENNQKRYLNNKMRGSGLKSF